MVPPDIPKVANKVTAVFASRPSLAIVASVSLGAAALAWPAIGEVDYKLWWTFGLFAALVSAGVSIRYFAIERQCSTYFSKPAIWWTLAITVAAICAVIVILSGRYQLGGFDHSVVIDMGWRLVQGQQPYRDFPCTVPIGFVLGSGYAMRLFGVSWDAVVGFQSAFSAITFLWQAVILKRLTTPVKALVLAATCQIISNLVTDYWWYNPATTTCGVLFLLSALWFSKEPKSNLAGLSYTLALTLLASMKPNIGAVLITGVTTTLFFCRPTRVRTILWSALAFSLFLSWLALHHLNLLQVLDSYLSVSGRGFSLEQFLQDMDRREKAGMLLLWSLLLLPWLTMLAGNHLTERLRKAGFWLAATSMAAGSFGFITNGESKLVDMPLMLLGSWWLLAEVANLQDEWKVLENRWFAGMAALLATVGLTVGFTRHRVKVIGQGMFFEYDVSSEKLQSPFFKNLHSGKRLITVEREILKVRSSALGGNCYFGPRMQWAYAALSLPSPINEPVWWHPGVAFPMSEENYWIDRWLAARHSPLVFLDDDFTYFPARLKSLIADHYRLVPGYDSISIYTLIEPIK
jgi:hypothetical protein